MFGNYQNFITGVFLHFTIISLLFGCQQKQPVPLNLEDPTAINYVYPVPDEKATALELHKYAASQWGKGNYEESLYYATIAYEKAKSANDHEIIAKLLNNIGLAHWKLGDNRSALNSFEESGRIAEKLSIKYVLAMTYTNRSLILREEEAFTTAKELNRRAIHLFKLVHAPRDLAIAYNNYGQIFKKQEEMDSAQFYYEKAAEIYDTIDYKDGKSATYGNFADVYLYLNQKDKAISFAKQSLALGEESESKVRIGEGYQKLSNVYAKFNVFDSAFKYQQKYADHQEQVYKANLSDKLAEYQSKMGNELHKLRIENLEKEKVITRNRIGMVLGVIFTFLVFVAFLMNRRFAKVTDGKKQLEKELEHSHEILEIKQKELVSYIVDLSRKNTQINKLQKQLSKEFASEEERIAELLHLKILTDEDWERFKSKFTVLFPDFLIRIRNYGIGITEAEVRYLVLNQLKLSPKEMACILGVSDSTIHVYKMRLKKKLQEAGFPSVEDFMGQL